MCEHTRLRLVWSVQLKATAADATCKPTGKVVGIIKRNWRPFCGMLNVSHIKEVSLELHVESPRLVSVISSFLLLLLLSVNQTSLYPRGPSHSPHSDRDATGFRAGGPKDHGGHRRLAKTLQIPKCESEKLFL